MYIPEHIKCDDVGKSEYLEYDRVSEYFFIGGLVFLASLTCSFDPVAINLRRVL